MKDTKELYTLINPSDPITFYAETEDIARVVALILGEGKLAVEDKEGKAVPYTLTAFKEPPEWVYEQLEDILENEKEVLKDTLNTLAIVNKEEREVYDKYTNNGRDKEKRKE